MRRTAAEKSLMSGERVRRFVEKKTYQRRLQPDVLSFLEGEIDLL